MAIDPKEFQKTKYSGIKIHKDGITFLFDIRVQGKRFRKTWKANVAHTKSDRLKNAFFELEKFRERKNRDMQLSTPVYVTVGEYWQKVLKLKNWSPRVAKDYSNFFNYYLEPFRDMKIREMKPHHFTNLNITLKHLSLRTRKKWYEIMKPIFDLAMEDEIIEKSPIKKSHVPKRDPKKEKRVVMDALDKYRKVHAAIMELFADNPHHRAFFLFGFHGRRLSEVGALRWEDIDFENDQYAVRKEASKVGVDMTLALPGEVKEALMKFKEESGPIFFVKQPKYWYAKIRELSGVEEFSFHWMRNLAVSAMAAKGVSATDLSAMLGHMDAYTLKKYLSLQRVESTSRTNFMANEILKKD